MKEFLEKSGIPFEEINMSVNPERGAKLKRHGLSVPSVMVGDQGVAGLDLAGIAQLIGYDSYQAPQMLSPSELKGRYDVIGAAMCRLIAQIPTEGLDYRSPDRDRSFRVLATHVGTIMRKFLEAYDSETFDNSARGPEELRASATTADLFAWATGTVEMFQAWWELRGFDDPLDRVVATQWGYRTLHEVLERAVWHTGQHTRQVALFLERLGIEPNGKLTMEDLAGLPVPDGIFA
jgi:uncharacterized damage-inducible protein DinB